MKFQAVAALAVVFGSLVSLAPARGQTGAATYGKEALENLGPGLTKAEQDGFVMEARNTTFFGGWLPKGNKQGNEPWVGIITLRNLDPNREYRIVASGDNDSHDLDLRVVDPKGEVVARDASAARNAEVTFRPARQQDYVIQVRLYDSRDNAVCMAAYLRR